MLSNIGLNDLAIVIVSIVIAMSFHEAMHAFVANALGDKTALHEGRLTLNPLKHIDLLTTVLLPVVLIIIGLPPLFIARPVPFNPYAVKFEEYGVALVGVAGPLTNLALAFLASLLIRFNGGGDGHIAYYLAVFMQVNIAFFVFNMIPFPPLDGSRLLYAVAPEPVQRAMERIEQAGFGVTVLVFLVLSPFIMPLIGNITENIFTFLLR